MRKFSTPISLAALLLVLYQVAPAQELLSNGGLEMNPGSGGGPSTVPPFWNMDEGAAPPAPEDIDTAQPANFSHISHGSTWNIWFEPYTANAFNGGTFAHVYQDVAGTPGLKYTMTGFALFEDYYPGGVVHLNAGTTAVPTGAPFDDGPLSPTDSFFALEFLDASNAVLPGSVVKELMADGQPANTTWMQHTLSGVAPAGTVMVRVRASMTGGVQNPLPSPETFKMSYFVDDFSLTASAPVAGDFNGDSFVDGKDFLIWQQNVGRTSGATPNQGDADNNGAVNDLDLLAWQNAFGTSAMPAAGIVPEPTSVGYMGLALTVFIAARHKR